MPGGYVHRLDPVLADVGGLHLWWYGAGFALGFLHLHRVVMREHARLGLSRRAAWSLSILMAVGVLVGGRAVQIAFDEWPFYRAHPQYVAAFWLGGMATHGLLLGAAAAAALFAVVWRVPFLALADTLAVPGAFLMGVGRLGNFIDGQIVGAVTDGWWGVKFPYADGFRHPVVLYDGAKNLLLMLYLMRVRRRQRTPGAVAARFVFWYAAPRIVIDLLRDYPTHRLALGTGQTLNLVMAALGAVLLWRSRQRRLGRLRPVATPTALAPGREARPTVLQRALFATVVAACLLIPSNWTQDVPRRYGARHPGLTHSWFYPPLDWTPPPASSPPPR
ncbi:MAG: prolipoprotein diacylglyceryl transferase [Vicinamibacterales bacterium]